MIGSIVVVASCLMGIDGMLGNAVAQDIYSEANSKLQHAQDIYDVSLQELCRQQYETADELQKLAVIKLDLWSREMVQFLQLYNRFADIEFTKNIYIDKPENLKPLGNHTIKQILQCSLNAYNLKREMDTIETSNSLLANLALEGANLLNKPVIKEAVTATLTASLGTNLTMMFLGGEAIPATLLGGLSIAGIALGPVIGYIGNSNYKRAEMAFEEAKYQAGTMIHDARVLDTVKDLLKGIKGIAYDYRQFYNRYAIPYAVMLDNLASLVQTLERQYGVRQRYEFDLLSDEQQHFLQIVLLATQVIYNMLTAPLTAYNGQVHSKARERLEIGMSNALELLGE